MRLLSKTSEVYMNFNQSFAQDNEEGHTCSKITILLGYCQKHRTTHDYILSKVFPYQQQCTPYGFSFYRLELR